MAGLKRFQFVGKDHAAIVEECVLRIKERYPSIWNDFYEDSSGMMLVEVFAYIVDLLLFYLDRQANETYLPTATERQNLINLSKLVGYLVSGARPAQVLLTFLLRNPHTKTIVIPKGFVVESNDGISFETDEDVTIPPGVSSATCAATEGETYVEDVGRSDGTIMQEYFLPRASVIEVKTITVGGVEWTQVDSVIDQSDEAKVYMVDMDALGRARITFGDGANGRVPEVDAVIRATYRVGGGIRGNVAAGALCVARDIVVDEDGDRVTVEVMNEVPASGGVDPESLDQIRLWAPRYFEAQNRCVTQTDYETAAMTFQDKDAGRIAKARAIVRERTGEANVVRYYLLAYSSDTGKLASASQPLKDALLEYVNKRKMFTDWIEIEDGVCRYIPFRGTIRIARGVSRPIVLESVNRALVDLMKVELRSMGESLQISDVYAAIDNVSGVLSVELESPTATIGAEIYELLLMGETFFTLEEGENDGTNR